MSSGILNPKPYKTANAGEREILDGVLLYQQDKWWLRVDGSAALWGPVKNKSPAVAGDSACVAISQTGALYVVYPAGSNGGGSGNVDGGKPDSVYGGLPVIDGNGVTPS